MLDIPDDAVEYVREVFAACNRGVSQLLADQPNIREEGLDFELISVLNRRGMPVRCASGTIVAIETHWLGGRSHFYSWEIADIGIIVLLRHVGQLQIRKVALLQSKRLYPTNRNVKTEDQSDYMIGFGRIGDIPDKIVPLSRPMRFRFAEDSLYGALNAGSKQVIAIDQYMTQRRVPVYYSFYNPPRLPFERVVPLVCEKAEEKSYRLACRIVPAEEVHRILNDRVVGSSPRFMDVVTMKTATLDDSESNRGWRLEYFVADLLLRCREGRLVSGDDREDMRSLFYRRSGPIAAAIAITIDLPGAVPD